MKRVYLALIVLVPTAGCTLGSASMVRRDQFGGTLALHGQPSAAMEDASSQMSGHCQGPYTIVNEERVVVGQQTQHNSDTDYDQAQDYGGTYGGQSTQASTTTSDITEHRVTYKCGTVTPVTTQPTTAEPIQSPPPPAATVPPAPAEAGPQSPPAAESSPAQPTPDPVQPPAPPTE